MTVMHDTHLPDTALPGAALKRHLRLGSGFAEDDVQDDVLSSFLRAALAAVEGRTHKALVARDMVLALPAWPEGGALALPVAPVLAVHALRAVAADGTATLGDPAGWRLVPDSDRPRILARGPGFPRVTEGGQAEVSFRAGFAEDFGDLPADLAQAVLLLAAHYYEFRDETALAEGCMPFGVTSLLARYRRLSLGAAQ